MLLIFSKQIRTENPDNPYNVLMCRYVRSNIFGTWRFGQEGIPKDIMFHVIVI